MWLEAASLATQAFVSTQQHAPAPMAPDFAQPTFNSWFDGSGMTVSTGGSTATGGKSGGASSGGASSGAPSQYGYGLPGGASAGQAPSMGVVAVAAGALLFVVIARRKKK